MSGDTQSGETAAAVEDNYYNNVFERLVDDASDDDQQLLGLVAYGLYKIGKREWVMEFQKENGRRPNDGEYRAHARAQTDSTMDGYRAQATMVVSAYAGSVLELERPKIEAAALKGNFWRSFWPSFWSSVAFSLLLAFLALILYWLGQPIPLGPRGAPEQVQVD